MSRAGTLCREVARGRGSKQGDPLPPNRQTDRHDWKQLCLRAVTINQSAPTSTRDRLGLILLPVTNLELSFPSPQAQPTLHSALLFAFQNRAKLSNGRKVRDIGLNRVSFVGGSLQVFGHPFRRWRGAVCIHDAS